MFHTSKQNQVEQHNHLMQTHAGSLNNSNYKAESVTQTLLEDKKMLINKV